MPDVILQNAIMSNTLMANAIMPNAIMPNVAALLKGGDRLDSYLC
jgi:hypothetical protein